MKYVIKHCVICVKTFYFDHDREFSVSSPSLPRGVEILTAALALLLCSLSHSRRASTPRTRRTAGRRGGPAETRASRCSTSLRTRTSSPPPRWTPENSTRSSERSEVILPLPVHPLHVLSGPLSPCSDGVFEVQRAPPARVGNLPAFLQHFTEARPLLV